MNFSILKPLLTVLVLPPAGPLLLAFIGVLLLYRQRKTAGRICVALGLIAAWTLSCNLAASFLNQQLLKQYAFIQPSDLTAQPPAQAIVVLGGGIQTYAPEYQDVPQPSRIAATRLRYGAWLALQTDIPLAFSGGKGWASHSSQTTTETDAAEFYLQAFSLPHLTWRDDQSADTAQNARQMARILIPQKIKRIALVTHAWHMERATYLFTAQGFDVIPAPLQTITPESYDLLNLIPSAEGTQNTAHVLKEFMGLLAIKLGLG